jgi:hypothetical protein
MKSHNRFRPHIIITSTLVGIVAFPFWLSLSADRQRQLDTDLLLHSITHRVRFPTRQDKELEHRVLFS